MRRATILTLSGALALLLAVPALAALAPGAKAPDFDLVDTAGIRHALKDYLADGKIVVLEWFNPDCSSSSITSCTAPWTRPSPR
jgi:hypothetical protein